MKAAHSTQTPYISLRHARIGRLGESGQLPAGWNVEYLTSAKVLDVSSLPIPWLTLAFTFAPECASDYVGFSVGPFIAAPKNTDLVLAGEVASLESINVEAAYMIVREWRVGGEFVCQSTQPTNIDAACSMCVVRHRVSGDDRVAQPVFLVKRQSAAGGAMTATMRGLAFGSTDGKLDWSALLQAGA